jgi:hypothetical protein
MYLIYHINHKKTNAFSVMLLTDFLTTSGEFHKSFARLM